MSDPNAQLSEIAGVLPEVDGQQPLDAMAPEPVFSNYNRSEAYYSHLTHVSPLPPASEVRGLNDVDPNFSSFLMDQVRAEQKHRHSMDNKAVDANIQLAHKELDNELATSRRGQWIGGSLAAIVLVGGIGLGFAGFTVLATVLVGIDVVGLAGVFVYSAASGRRSRQLPRTSRDAIDSGGTPGDTGQPQGALEGSEAT